MKTEQSTIREVATELAKVERKILWKVGDELEYIGVKCERVEVQCTPSKTQPFIDMGAAGEIGGLCGYWGFKLVLLDFFESLKIP